MFNLPRKESLCCYRLAWCFHELGSSIVYNVECGRYLVFSLCWIPTFWSVQICTNSKYEKEWSRGNILIHKALDHWLCQGMAVSAFMHVFNHFSLKLLWLHNLWSCPTVLLFAAFVRKREIELLFADRWTPHSKLVSSIVFIWVLVSIL